MKKLHRCQINETHLYKNAKWKRLTQVEVENHLFPYMFNSKGDNLGQREIQIEFETIW